MGRAMVLVNSSEKNHSLKKYLSGIRAKKTSNQRMNFSAKARRLTSFWCRAIKSVGKTFDQNVLSFPNET